MLEHFNAAALAGSTRTKLKRRKLSTTKGNAQGKYKTVSYCPFETIANLADPELHTHVVVNPGQKVATCKNGHSWEIR